MWQVSLYADQSHSCTLTEGSPIYPHCNGPYYPCHDPYGPQRFKYGIQSVKGRLRSVNCISLVGNIFMARVDIYGLSIRTDRTDRKSDMGSVNCISLEVIHGLPIRTDRADRKSDIRSVNCISLVELRIFSWQERSYMVCRSVRTVRIAKVIYGDYFKLFLRRIHMMWTKFLLKLSRAFALFTRLIWRKRSFYELSWTGQNQMLFVYVSCRCDNGKKTTNKEGV